MSFEVWSEAQYRSAEYPSLVEYRDGLIEHRDELSAEEWDAQFAMCKAAFARADQEAQLRSLDIKNVLGGSGSIVDRSGAETEEDPYDTAEYRNAFMDYVCRGKQMPEKFRTGVYMRTDDANTTTGDIPVMIPTTLMKEIIEKLESFGEIWNGVRKLNVKGGIEFPVLDLNPVAYWVGEEEVSPYQELLANTKVSFGYHEIECRLSQSWLASIVSFSEFQSRFVPAAANAIIKKLDESIISGNGTGKMLGILNDERITNTATMTEADMADWKQYRKNIKHAIPKEYRKGGVFMMNQGTWDAYIETLADDENAPVSIGYNPVTGDEIKRLMGYQVLITDQLPEFDEAEDEEVFMIYGRLQDYCVNSNQTMQTYQWVDPETRKKKVLSYMVADGKVLDPYGFVLVAKSGSESL